MLDEIIAIGIIVLSLLGIFFLLRPPRRPARNYREGLASTRNGRRRGE